MGIWVAPISFCVEHHRHFLAPPFYQDLLPPPEFLDSLLNSAYH